MFIFVNWAKYLQKLAILSSIKYLKRFLEYLKDRYNFCIISTELMLN